MRRRSPSRVPSADDPGQFLKNRDAPVAHVGTPIVLISSCASERERGDAPFNGGVKLYNLWAALLRRHGVPAYIVTFDGEHAEWLEHHQPTISLATARAWKEAGLPLRFMTSWLGADAFIDLSDRLYFYDAESVYTFGLHRRRFRSLLRRKLAAIATHSRTQQARHFAFHGRDTPLIPEWSDPSVWHPDDAIRVPGRIGYTDESSESHAEAERLAALCAERGLTVDLVHASGVEHVLSDVLRSCDIFVGLNHGKDPLWGEGCPRTQQEAMHSGCVVVAYDVRGNREYLIDRYSGRLVGSGDIDRLADAVVDVLSDARAKEQLRRASISLVSAAFVGEPRWPDVAVFLDLPSATVEAETATTPPSREVLEAALGDPVYMAVEEIPAFAELARRAQGTSVEIGAAYGGSTALLLTSLPRGSELVSVDPFVPDSMSGFQATRDRCLRNVVRAVARLGDVSVTARWTLKPVESLVAARGWGAKLGLLYIDGDHRYEAVHADFLAWSSFLREGGTLVIHDSRRLEGAPDDEFARGWPGPTRLARELRSHACVELESEVFSMTVWRRTGRFCAACGEQAS